MLRFIFPLFIATILSTCKKELSTPAPAATIQSLNANWELRQADTDDWMPVANIPSTVHTALLENKKIENPFYRNNEASLQWVETKDWEYRHRFEVAESLLQEEVVELTFKGLDTYAEVFLNGQKILEADNMFRSWLVDVKPLLQKENNELRILFHSPGEIENKKWAALGYELPDGSRRAVTRKAAFHYGWDGGPRFVTMGPWRGIELKGWSKALINQVQYRTIMKFDNATIQAFFDVDAKAAGAAVISVNIDGKTFQKEVELKAGNNKDSLSFTLIKPELWWPNGLGKQHLYNISGSIQGNGFSDTKEDRIGIRKLVLRQPVDNDGVGFYFEVNGIRVFAKGANYVPQDIFQDRVSNADYQKLLKDAQRANMNMLRVWGGGIYENEDFYDTCDELGLMVWQDFMFANAMVPGDEAFQQNVAAEAKEQVERLNNHPCMALWCGNNEISEGWHRWGWQDGLTEEHKKKIWDDYLAIFKKILPEAVSNNNPTIPYWESSPQYGRGDENSTYVGDSHYWGVWQDAEPFEYYSAWVPRFMSAFGFQALPDIRTIEEFTLPEDRDLDSEVMKAHQKHARGTALIKEYMARDYRTPKDFDNFVYVSQLLQADGVRLGIESQLQRLPYCMGSLFWQLNDCWPVTSWSSIDHNGHWKALHYAAKKAFEPVTISISNIGGFLTPMIVNHTKQTITVIPKVRVIDFDGNVTFNRTFPTKQVAPASADMLPGATKAQMSQKGNSNYLLVYMELLNADSSFITATHVYVEKQKDLNLPIPNINATISKTDEGYLLKLQTDKLAKSLYLQTEVAGWFSDNYFDLLPGIAKEVLFVPENGAVLSEGQLRWRSLVDSY
jgi:beta-mannosidase